MRRSHLRSSRVKCGAVQRIRRIITREWRLSFVSAHIARTVSIRVGRQVDVAPEESMPGLKVRAEARCVGPTGVEMAGQIAELAQDLRGEFRSLGSSKAQILLVETGDRVLQEFPPSLSARAERSLAGLGVTIGTRQAVVDIRRGVSHAQGAGRRSSPGPGAYGGVGCRRHRRMAGGCPAPRQPTPP